MKYFSFSLQLKINRKTLIIFYIRNINKFGLFFITFFNIEIRIPLSHWFKLKRKIRKEMRK